MAEVPGSKEARVGVSKENLDEPPTPAASISMYALVLADAHVMGKQQNLKIVKT